MFDGQEPPAAALCPGAGAPLLGKSSSPGAVEDAGMATCSSPDTPSPPQAARAGRQQQLDRSPPTASSSASAAEGGLQGSLAQIKVIDTANLLEICRSAADSLYCHHRGSTDARC